MDEPDNGEKVRIRSLSGAFALRCFSINIELAAVDHFDCELSRLPPRHIAIDPQSSPLVSSAAGQLITIISNSLTPSQVQMVHDTPYYPTPAG